MSIVRFRLVEILWWVVFVLACLCVGTISVYCSEPTTVRVWHGTRADDGAIHCLGDGKLAAYEQGPDIVQMFGPPYSSPTAAELRLEWQDSMEVRSHREWGSAIWTHEIYLRLRKVGSLLDFVDADLPCLVRQISTEVPLRLRLRLASNSVVITNGDRFKGSGAAGGLLVEMPAGQPIFMDYLTRKPTWHQLVWTGNIRLEKKTNQVWEFVCGPGEGLLLFAGGPEYPDTIQNMERALTAGTSSMLERTRRHWQGILDRRTDFSSRLARNLPSRGILLNAIDAVAVLITAQQAEEGGVLAGHKYHWCGVRDQYGVSRGLLALGMPERARAILEYYWDIWQHEHAIHNGQGIGDETFFHIHENDGVEITGYLILQAFDYLEYTGDQDFLEKLLPMLEWAWELQKENLVLDMLPFNGDETYVAGGLLPRSALNDGSAEATLLFVESGKKLLTWAESHHRWAAPRIKSDRQIFEQVKRNYRKNFWRNGRLITNNPDRASAAVPPKFRHGVCERCMAEGRFQHLTWNERSSAGRYLCPICLAKGPYPAAPPKIYELPSVSLVPFYLHSNLIPRKELRPMVRSIARQFLEKGYFSPGGDASPAEASGKVVGYDIGLLLYALTDLKDPLAKDVFEKTLRLADATGAWAEYYEKDAPRATRCRPWESAINLESLLYWATQ